MRGVPVRVRHDDATGPAMRGAGAHTATEDALVARLQALSGEFAATPDVEFRAATRTRLVAMAAVRTPAAETAGRRPPVRAGAMRRLLAGAADAPVPPWRTRLTAGLAGAALTVTALGGLLGAAQGAHPGDLLYDLKRGGEQTQLALAGDSRRGPTLLDFASTRLDELHALVGVQPNADAVVGTTPSGGEAGLAAGPDVDLVVDTLQTMDAQTTEGTAALTSRAVQQSDPGALGVLTGWAAGQQSGIDEVADAVPSGAQGALVGARDLVGQVAARGTALQQALACPGGPSTEGADELGPLPADCPPAAPATPGAPAPSGSSVPDSAPSGTSTATSVAAPGTTAPAPATTAAPGTTASRASSGGVLPTAPAPVTSARPGLPLPSVPGLPGAPTTSAAPSSSPGALISVPPLVPGVSVCVPPLITVGC
jgi:hypothetical protein